MAIPPVTTGTLVVFALIAVAVTLFVAEPVPADTTAIGVLVALAVLEPVTGVAAADAIAGFASPATVAILAMYMLSKGVERTGLVDRLGAAIERRADGDPRRVLAATLGTTGLSAGFVNNTPVVAVFIPMVNGIAERSGLSPSRLLMPLSFAAMMGGTLTLIGTSTNLLASDLAGQLLGRRIGMFTFTAVGVPMLLVGTVYLLVAAPRLLPDRVAPTGDLTEEFGVGQHLRRFRVEPDSPLVGRSVAEIAEEIEADPDVRVVPLQVDRGETSYRVPATDVALEPGDWIVVLTAGATASSFRRRYGLLDEGSPGVAGHDLRGDDAALVEAVVLPDGRLVGETVAESRIADRFEARILAVKRGETVLKDDVDAVRLERGDTLLMQAPPDTVAYLEEAGDVFVSHDPSGATTRGGAARGTATGPPPVVPVGILAAVVLLAAVGAVPIVIAALGGVVAMVVTRTLTPSEAYDAVSWNVIFLLAGVLPLGVALQRTGGDAVIAAGLAGLAGALPPVAVLALFFVVAGLVASVITPVASVVLMAPIAVDTAERIGAAPFAFLMITAYGVASAFMTPIGYQTNLMVYGPGGYRFGDYVRLGAPLHLLLAVVATVGVAVVFGV